MNLQTNFFIFYFKSGNWSAIYNWVSAGCHASTIWVCCLTGNRATASCCSCISINIANVAACSWCYKKLGTNAEVKLAATNAAEVCSKVAGIMTWNLVFFPKIPLSLHLSNKWVPHHIGLLWSLPHHIVNYLWMYRNKSSVLLTKHTIWGNYLATNADCCKSCVQQKLKLHLHLTKQLLTAEGTYEHGVDPAIASALGWWQVDLSFWSCSFLGSVWFYQ